MNDIFIGRENVTIGVMVLTQLLFQSCDCVPNLTI